MDMNGAGSLTSRQAWQASGLPGLHCRGSSAHVSDVKIRDGVRGMLKFCSVPFLIHTALKCRQHVAPRWHFGSVPGQGWQAAHRTVGTYMGARQARGFGDESCGKSITGLFSVKCLVPALCPSVPFALCRTLPRHGLGEGAVLTSVGTGGRPYQTLGERPVVLHPRSYRTLGHVPGGGVAWCCRRR